MAPPGLAHRTTMALAAAITVLLFAQWPLREWAGGGALLANDTAQALFALYVAVAVAWASERGTQLSLAGHATASPAGTVSGSLAAQPAQAQAQAQPQPTPPNPASDATEPAPPIRWRQAGAALAPLPWCLWVLATSVQPAWFALMQTERFPDSANPGYFLIKLAVPLLAGLLAWHSLRALRSALRRPLG